MDISMKQKISSSYLIPSPAFCPMNPFLRFWPMQKEKRYVIV